MKLGAIRLLRALGPAVLGAALAVGAGTGLAQAKGTVAGKVVDQQGKPVEGVTIRFTALGEDGEPKTVTSRKKGRFVEGGLHKGQYRVDLVSDELFLAHLEFRLVREDGLAVSQGSAEGHPRDGVSGLPVSDLLDVELKLVVAPIPEEGARETELSVALPALGTAATLYNQGKFEEVVTETQRILAADPEQGEALYVQGLALEKLGRRTEAESVLRHAAERIPDYERIWEILGEVTLRLATDLEAKGETEPAREAYTRAAEALTEAVRRNPQSLALELNLAASLDRIGADDRLAPVLEHILEMDPENLQSRLRLASLYSRAGQHDRALELLQAIPDTEKRVAVTIYNIGVRLNDDGDPDGALLAARRAVEIDPALSHAWRLIVQILLAKADHPGAAAAIRSFLEAAPDDPEAPTYRNLLEQLEPSQP